MSHRAALLVAAGLAAAALSMLRPPPVAAHAIGIAFTLPVPLVLYLAGAGLTVAASFAVSVLVVRPAGPVPGYPSWPVNAGVARATSVLLQGFGLFWWPLWIIAAPITLEPGTVPAAFISR